jgi:hypothetical protein
MIRNIKNYIKTKPRLFDLINSVRPIKSNVHKWLDRFSLENNRKVNFLQIGANDGLRGDPIRRFIIRDDWNGIFVEPLPIVVKMLKDNYAYLKGRNLIFVNRSIDFETNHPKAILFESHSLGIRKQEIYDFLSEKDYNVLELGGDTVAEYGTK